MKWTKEKPTVDGHYWFRWNNGFLTNMMVIEHSKVFMVGVSVCHIDDFRFPGYFYGPIEPPPFEGER